MVDEQRTGRATGQPDDATLLTAVAHVWQQMDPPPVDLAEGVLAAIAAEDLEFDLLTLVSSDGALAGVRHASPEGRDDAGAWMLEYEGQDVRIYVRLTTIEDRRRLDGWVVPVRPLSVELRSEGHDEPLVTEVDEFGRFEFATASPGLSRLTFLDPAGDTARPRITPPFWI
jgi:hypothetical protein